MTNYEFNIYKPIGSHWEHMRWTSLHRFTIQGARDPMIPPYFDAEKAPPSVVNPAILMWLEDQFPQNTGNFKGLTVNLLEGNFHMLDVCLGCQNSALEMLVEKRWWTVISWCGENTQKPEQPNVYGSKPMLAKFWGQADR